MKYEDLVIYFDRYIKQYLPFKDEKFYIAFTNFLINTYLKDTYSNIPYNLKQFIENFTIPVDFYDPILKSLGFPDKLLRICSINQKEILLRNFSDYNKYKGTKSLITRTLAAFNQKINAFELFIDYNEDIQDWQFNPSLIYQDTRLDLDDDPLDWDYVYDRVPRFLISKDTLEGHRTSNNIILPVKSTVLFLDYFENLYFGPLNTLIFSATYHNFKDALIIFYLSNGVYTSTLAGLFQLWLYILLRKYEYQYLPFPLSNIAFFDTSVSVFPYPLEDSIDYDVKDLLDEYNSITTRTQMDSFLKDHFQDVFSTQYENTNTITYETLDEAFRSPLSPVGEELLDSIISRLDSAISLDTEYDTILLELRASFLTWTSTTTSALLKEYDEYLLKFLDVTFVPNFDETSVIYNLLELFKPIHTDLLYREKVNIRVFDLFNSILIDSEDFSVHYHKDFISGYTITTDPHYTIIRPNYDSLILKSFYSKQYLRINYDTNYLIEENPIQIYRKDLTSVTPIQDSYIDNYNSIDNSMSCQVTSCISKNGVTIIIDEDILSEIEVPIEETYSPPDYSFAGDCFSSSRSQEGNYLFNLSNIIDVDEIAYDSFDINDYIYSPGSSSLVAKQIVSKDPTALTFTLSSAYDGLDGPFTKAYKYYREVL